MWLPHSMLSGHKKAERAIKSQFSAVDFTSLLSLSERERERETEREKTGSSLSITTVVDTLIKAIHV